MHLATTCALDGLIERIDETAIRAIAAQSPESGRERPPGHANGRNDGVKAHRRTLPAEGGRDGYIGTAHAGRGLRHALRAHGSAYMTTAHN